MAKISIFLKEDTPLYTFNIQYDDAGHWIPKLLRVQSPCNKQYIVLPEYAHMHDEMHSLLSLIRAGHQVKIQSNLLELHLLRFFNLIIWDLKDFTKNYLEKRIVLPPDHKPSQTALGFALEQFARPVHTLGSLKLIDRNET